MLKKIVFILIPLCQFIFADHIQLSSGKEIIGKIESYSSLEGLKVQVDYGSITIKHGDIVSFRISNDSISDIQAATTLETSELYRLGYSLDVKMLPGYKISYDSELLHAGKMLVELVNIDRGFYALIGKESMGIESEKYLQLLIESRKPSFQYYVDGNNSEFSKNGIKYYIKEFSAKIQGQEMSYFFATFMKNDINYRIVFWTFTPVYEKYKDEAKKILTAISQNRK